MPRSFLSLYCPNIASDRLTKLVEWCDSYSPLVSQDGQDGVILDITGCSHLFGGENLLLINLQRRLQRMNIESHGAIADTRGAAWTLARYGDLFIVHGENTAAALDPLPIMALRLPAETVSELQRFGLATIAAVRNIPKQSLRVRFGAILLCRLDQVFQEAEDPLTPWRPPAAYRASRITEPISTVGSVEYVLLDLLREVCTQLEKNHLGLRRIDLSCYRVDGTVDRCEVRTSKPNRSVAHLMRLFSDRLEKLRADFGFETFVLSVCDAEALHAKQLNLPSSDKPPDEESFDLLVDRLGLKLGFSEVNRIRVRESYLPEHSVELRPAGAPPLTNADWPAYRVRPLRMVDPPMPIQVSIVIPGGSPVQFLIGQRKHLVVRMEGPERLIPEWWRTHHMRWGTRDYYRVEDDNGFRFWIFRDASEHWFLHGHFA
jgi:protein ImuB